MATDPFAKLLADPPPARPFDGLRLMTLREMIALDSAPRKTERPPRDFRGQGPEGPPIRLSDYRPLDRIRTDGADVWIKPDGSPQVKLRRGYENGRSAGLRGPVLIPPGPSGVSIDEHRAEATHHTPLWFHDQVQNRGPWDYKQGRPQYEAFGNFHYGATGRAVGIPPLPTDVLFQEAGRAQPRTNRRPEFGKPGVPLLPFTGTGSYGDDPIDQFWIAQGARYKPGSQ